MNTTTEIVVGSKVHCITAGGEHLRGTVQVVDGNKVRVDTTMRGTKWFYAHELKAEPAFTFCNCENTACQHSQDGKMCDIQVPAGQGARALYIGVICTSCMTRMDKDYLFPPHGTAGRHTGE